MKFYILLRLSSLGDIILASGLPHYIKEREPESKVIIIRGSSFEGIFPYNPQVDIDVRYEKQTRDTTPSLQELCKLIHKMADSAPRIEIHFADLQNNKRSNTLLYLFMRYLRKEIVDRDLFLSHLELEKYRGAKLAMVYGKYMPLFISGTFGSKNKSSSDAIAALTTKTSRRRLQLRTMLKLPFVILRYYDTVYGKGTARRNKQIGKRVHIMPEIWLKKDQDLGRYLPNDRINKQSDQQNKHIVLAPGAAHFNKRWPSEKFAELADLFVKNNWKVTLVGGPNDSQLLNEIILMAHYKGIDHFVSEGGAQDTALLLDEYSAVITNDSAVAHIAYARRIPVFAIFGATVPELGFAPKSDRFTVIQDDEVNCRPCTHIGSERCPKGHFRCMLNIKPKTIFDTVQSLLKI